MKQPIVGGYNNDLSPAATEYNCLMGGTPWNTTENHVYECMPTAGTIGRLFVELSAAVVAGSSFTFTLMVDGVASALHCHITAGNTTGSETGITVDVVAGQTVSIQSTYSGTPGTPKARWTTQFVGTTSGESICLAIILADNTAYSYGGIQSNTEGTSIEASVKSPMPTPGTFKKLYVQLSEDPGTSPDAYTIVLRVGEGSKNNTVTIVADNTSGNITNVTDVVAAGSDVDFRIGQVSTPSAAPYCAIGIVFVSNTDGESLIIESSYGTPDVVDIEYQHLCVARGSTWVTTESYMYSLIQACTIRKLYVSLSVAPGVGKSYDISINKDGGAASGLTVHIHETDVAGHDTAHTYNPTDGDTADIKCVPTSTPAATYIHIGLVAYITAGAPALGSKSANMADKLVAAGVI